MTAEYNAPKLDYDPYILVVLNGAIKFGEPKHMAIILSSLQQKDIEYYETDITNQTNGDNAQLYEKIAYQCQWVTEFAANRIRILSNEIGSANFHRNQIYDDVNMLLAGIKGYAKKFGINFTVQEHMVKGALEIMVDMHFPLN